MVETCVLVRPRFRHVPRYAGVVGQPGGEQLFVDSK